MPSFERESNRIVIAGASSLLGAELKSLLEESRFAGWDLRLVDEELAAGTLTEAGGDWFSLQDRRYLRKSIFGLLRLVEQRWLISPAGRSVRRKQGSGIRERK